MGRSTKRLDDADYYEITKRTNLFSQGDVFRDIPLSYPTLIGEYKNDQEHQSEEYLAAGTRRFLSGPLDFGFALLINPSCSITAQGVADSYAHPIRTLLTIQPVKKLLGEGVLRQGQLDQLRHTDTFTNYMYLPALPAAMFPESLALLYYPITLHHRFLEGQRITQLTYQGTQHLQRKLVAYYGGIDVDQKNFNPPMD